MIRAAAAVLVLVSATAFAQADGGVAPDDTTATPPPTETTQTAVTPPAQTGSGDEIRAEVDAKVEAAKREMRDQISELRGQMATQAVAEGWQEEWVEEKRKLELFEIDGYLRMRPELFHKFDLGRGPDPQGFMLWERSPTSPNERTQAGANMRLRLDPSLNVSEEVRIRTQIDILDNLVLGSTPDYAFDTSNRTQFGIFSENQAAPRSGVNSLQDSLTVKRAYGEVSTPVGILRFGRMGSHWGLGMLRNDGNCLDCDHGDTVDRVQFVTEPYAGFYVTPMMDLNVEGPITGRQLHTGQPYDISNSDDSHSLIVAAARRDTDQQAKAKLENNLSVFNYGIHFTYRTQRNEATDFYNSAGPESVATGVVRREASLYVPDLWVKFEKKNFRIELEAAAIIGSLSNRALSSAQAADITQNQALSVLQFGGVLQGEYRLMDGALRIRGETGFASGDRAPGLGNRPGRRGSGDNGETLRGDFDGPQYACQTTGGCTDNSIRNFRFNRDYRVDMILWREILGPVTDTVYVKPGATYQVGDGILLFGDVIYSRAIYEQSTPSGDDPNLGVELNLGARYQTDDGFFAQLRWGVLFPMAGLDIPGRTASSPVPELELAQALRALVGIQF